MRREPTRRLGRPSEAREELRLAAGLAPTRPEKSLLVRRLDALSPDVNQRA